MPSTETEDGPRRDAEKPSRLPDERLQTTVEKVFSALLRRRLGKSAPETLHALLKSRGFDIDAMELLNITLSATIELPTTPRIAPHRALTREELAVLEDGGFDTRETDLTSVPVARGIAEYAALVATSLSVADAAKLLRVEASRIRQRLNARSLYGFKFGRAWKLPSFQFDQRGEVPGVVPGIEEVIENLPTDLHPVAVLSWFLAVNTDLPGSDAEETYLSPLEWLRCGNAPKPVAILASHL